MKKEIQTKIAELIANTTEDNVEVMAKKIKALLASDTSVSAAEQREVISRFLKTHSAEKSKLQILVEDCAFLARYVCKKMDILSKVKALYAEEEDGELRLYAVTTEGKVFLDLDEYIDWDNTNLNAKRQEVENLLDGEVAMQDAIREICSFGRKKKATPEPTPAPVEEKPKKKSAAVYVEDKSLPLGERMAQNLIAFGEFYVEENEIEDALALVLKYSDEILDLYVKRKKGVELVDLEELVGEDEGRHEMLNVIFSDEVKASDIKLAKELVAKHVLKK